MKQIIEKTGGKLVTDDSIMIEYERGFFKRLSHSQARVGWGSIPSETHDCIKDITL